MPALEEDAALLAATVREAGALAKSMFKRQIRIWQKPDNSSVTEADLAVDELLKTSLRDSRPGYGWLSEETADTETRLSRARMWIADPIDGTRSFIDGTDLWCIGVALIENGRPVLSALYRPVTDELYFARRGLGATLNGRPLAIGNRQALSGAKVLGSRSALRRLTPHGIVANSHIDTPMLLRLCQVAAGALDGAVSLSRINDWDLAAGDLIAHEAGGKVSGSDGKPYIYNRAVPQQMGLVAANPVLHGAMLVAEEQQ